jgi:hypothetical protein
MIKLDLSREYMVRHLKIPLPLPFIKRGLEIR